MRTERDVQVGSSKRHSVTLTAQDLADLTMIRNSPEAQRAIGATQDMSQAALLHTLLSHSLQHAREAADEAGYAALAASYDTDPEERAIRSALRKRRRVHDHGESAGA